MKVTCQRDGLLTACQLVSAAVAARTTKPVLSNVKATAEGDGLTLVAFDTEVGIRYELRGIDVGRHGSAILPIAQLTQILRESTDDELTLDSTDDGTKVKCGTSRFEMPGYPVEEFPDLPTIDDGGKYHEVSAGVLRAMIRRTAFAADKKDSTRFALSGVLWEADGKAARLVATDSKRLAVCEGPAALFGPPEATKGSHLVPAKAIGLLERNLTDDGELVRVALRPNEALFQTGTWTIYTRLVEGRYPPYRDIIGQTRKGAGVKVPLPVGPFLSRVRQAAIMTDDESKRVEMSFGPGAVTMQARGAETGSSEVELPLPEYDGPEVRIAFDPQYLVEFLRAVENEPTVTLEMTDGTKPALFRCGDGYQYLVMPLAG
ncbi:MAG: DNA polymerase III subunit beta [Gemmataceae bacterium]|nr:DNA polymerase III subunit beta [Gemmataceae bacterium]